MRPDWDRAVRHDDVGTLRRLLEEGADIDARDAHGQTGLMIAAASGAVGAAALLVERGAALDHTAKHHLSALMLAVVRGEPAIVRALAAAGADRSLRGSGPPGFHGKTALDLAEAAGRTEIVAILREAGRGPTPGPGPGPGDAL